MNQESTPMSTGVKVGIGAAFTVVWIGLCFAAYHSITAFEEGGWGIWPILAVLMVAIIVIIERTMYLFSTAVTDRRAFEAEVQKQLMHGNVAGAVAFCQSTRKPLGKPHDGHKGGAEALPSAPMARPWPRPVVMTTP